MALSAAEIGEKVFTAQVVLAMYEKAVEHDAEDSEEEAICGLLTDLMHFAHANGYVVQALVEEAQRRYIENTTGPVPARDDKEA